MRRRRHGTGGWCGAVGLVLLAASLVPALAMPGAAATAVTTLPSGFGAIAVDPVNSHVLVSSPSAGTITALDYTGAIVNTITGEAGPGAMVLANGLLYVALQNGGAIDVFNTSTWAKTATLASGKLASPGPLVIAGGKLWTSTGACGKSTTQLVSVDPSSGSATAYLMPSSTSLGYCIPLVFDPSNANLMLAWDVGSNPPVVSLLDVSSGAPQVVASQSETDLGNLEQLAFNPGGTTFVAASGYPYYLEEYSLSSLAPDGVTYATGAYPNSVVTTSERGGLILGGLNAAYSASVHTFHPAQPGTDLYTYAYPSTSETLYTRGLALSPDGSHLFAVSQNTSTGTTNFRVLPVANTTGTSVTASPSSAVPGTAVTMTAAVTVGAGGFSAPTGSVTFSDNGTTVSTQPLDGTGHASYTTSWPANGSHVITAAYSGDANNMPSSGQTTVLVGATPTVSLASSLNPAVAGQAVTFTATLTGGSSPTGTVNFTDGSASLGSSQVSGGQAALTTSTLSGGTHTITAVYSGDSANNTSTSSPLTETITVAPTTTTLAVSPNPAVAGQYVTLQATVSGGPAPIGGSVTFTENGSPLATVAVSAGSASFATNALPAGSYTLGASYSGDQNHAQSTSPTVSETVNANPHPTTTTVTATPSPAVVGQTVTFTATVSGGTSPTGTVTFVDDSPAGGGTLGTATLSGGTATLSTAKLAVGSNYVTGTYNGDGTNPISQGTVDEIINKASTTTTLVASPSSSTFGQSVTLTATVSGGFGPTGTVTFATGNSTKTTVQLSGGSASLTTLSPPVGTDTIVATYNGDTDNASSSGNATETVEATSTTTLTSSVNPVRHASPVTFTATIATTPSGTPLSGMVTFWMGSTQLGTTTVSGSTAAFTTSTLPRGTDTITAVYNGSSTVVGSTSNALAEQVK